MNRDGGHPGGERDAFPREILVVDDDPRNLLAIEAALGDPHRETTLFACCSSATSR
jgi:hypothetical protein